jgi:hypothetical protein
LAEHQRLVNETLEEEDGVLIVDGLEFPAHREYSVGWHRNGAGTAEKRTIARLARL